MKGALVVALACSVALSADSSQQRRPSESQAAIEKLRTDMKVPGARLAALDESDRALTVSDQAQTDVLGMLRTSERRILDEDKPALKARWDVFFARKQQYIASGCPWEGGRLPPPIAERCNRELVPLNAELIGLNQEEARLNGMLADIAKTRQAAYDTTLANWQKRKANYALRDDLEALKAAQEAQLRKLYLAGITEAVSRLDLRDKASQACGALSPLERSVCCHQVVWEGRNPAQCDVPLLYSVFEKAGIL